MELTLEVDMKGAWTIVSVAGELDLHTSPGLRDRVVELVEGGADHVAIEMSRVGFMDSSTLGVLVTCLKRLRERDGSLVLAAVQPSPMKVLTLTGLDRIFQIVASLDELPAG